jgi:hypothetical protein
MTTYKFKAVDQAALTDMLSQSQTRAGTSKGAELIEEFKASGNIAAEVSLPSTKVRNSVSISATNWCRSKGIKVWVRKVGGGTGTDLLLIDLDRADAATKRAYDNRPRPGRKPKPR